MMKQCRKWAVLALAFGIVLAESWGAEPPVILSFRPQTGPPGARVTIEGANLNEIQSVQLDGQTAEYGILEEGTVLYMVVPMSATSGLITIQTAAGQAVSEASFDVVVPGNPEIADFVPDSGEVGTAVIVRGSNFISVVAVRFNGLDAAFSSTDSGTVLATVPKNATSGPITVVTAFGSGISPVPFVVKDSEAPIVTAFSPVSGSEGTGVVLEGTALNQVSVVRFGDVPASFFVLSPNQIRALVPIGAKTAPITVESDAGRFTTTTHFTVTGSLVPVIETIIPMEGKPGTSVLLLGTNLHQTKAILFNGVKANFTTFSPGVVYTSVPEGATTGPITIETMAGTGTSASSFKVIVENEPAITGFSPVSGSPGTLVKITGDNLENVQEVFFNGMAASFTTHAGLQAEVPNGAASGPISVRTPVGLVVSVESFTVSADVDLKIGQSMTASWLPNSWQVTLAISVTNAGLASASSVLVSNVFEKGIGEPEGAWPNPGISNLTYKVIEITQGEFMQDPGDARWEIGELPAGGVVSLSLLVEGTVSGSIKSWASVSSVEPDSAPEDNLSVAIAQVGSLPRLELTRTADKALVLSWPADDIHWRLQSAPVLPSGPGDWVSLDVTPEESEGMNRVLVDATTGRQYYRLVLPP